LKLKYDRPRLNVAFNFNLRRYVTVVSSRRVTGFEGGPGSDAAGGDWTVVHRSSGPPPPPPPPESAGAAGDATGRTVQVDSLKTRVDSAYGFSA
jgi:hypothetical protein